jgi:hypothetical protein
MTVLKLLLPTSFLLSATAGAADGVNTALNTQTPSARSRTTRQQREVKLERQADGRGCVRSAPRVFPHINVDRCNFSHRQRSNFSLHSITAAAARFLRSLR